MNALLLAILDLREMREAHRQEQERARRLAEVEHVVEEPGALAGSAIDMASANPARFLRLEGEPGRIAPGQRANLVVADDALHVRETWIDGRHERHG